MNSRMPRSARGNRRWSIGSKGALAAFLVAVVAAAAAALSAQASEGPQNGRITFGKLDPALGDYSIWTANPDGTGQQRLVNVASFMSDWSPDGRRIAFDYADDTGVHIATMTPEGRRVHQLTSAAGIQELPKWAPDGRSITFDSSPVMPDDPAFGTSIWVMSSNETRTEQVTRDGFDVEPVFSPDGSQIAFARLTGTSLHGDQLSAVYVVNADGTHLHEIVPSLAGLEHPDWSPDGRWISFNIAPEAVDGPARGSVMAVHPNGGSLRILRRSTAQFGFFKPVWSPDGRKLLTGCHDTQAHIDKLCILDLHSRKVEVIIDDTPDPVNFPAWGPRPKSS